MKDQDSVLFATITRIEINKKKSVVYARGKDNKQFTLKLGHRRGVDENERGEKSFNGTHHRYFLRTGMEIALVVDQRGGEYSKWAPRDTWEDPSILRIDKGRDKIRKKKKQQKHQLRMHMMEA